MNTRQRRRRRGSILLLVAFSLVALCGFVALAVDVGLVAVAKTQAQAAADSAALAGTRVLDGRPVPDLAGATNHARTAAANNPVLLATLGPEDVDVDHGSYHYDFENEAFSPTFPPSASDSYNLTRVGVSRRSDTAFANVFGVSSFDVTARAVATHRPRDVAIVLDFSGSMNNESDLWNNEGYLGSANDSPNNRDPVFPRFGHYSDTTNAKLQTTSSDSRVGKCNITQPALGIPALVNDFYKHGRGSAAAGAFTAASDSYTTSPDPAGDDFLHASNNPSSAYVQTFYAMNGNSNTRNASFEVDTGDNLTRTGYDYYYYNQSGRPRYPFKGYVGGPKYWGKTFFVWPPDTRSTADWRQLYFRKTGGSHPNYGGVQNDNTKLWDSSGNWREPSGNYVINYAAILAWIKASPCPFPSQLRAGRILYYDSIPNDIVSSAYNHTNANSQITDQNQRFWKEYIDYVLGVWRDPFGVVQDPGSPSCSYGPDFNWGTVQITAKPSDRFMDYRDNPKRPRHRFWFGPMTMVQYISDVGMLPGTAHDISTYPAKLGITGALEDIKNNHPNDQVSLILFSRPQYENEPANVGAFTQAIYNLSRDYTGMINALWFPPGSASADVRPWSTAGRQVPRAYGDFTSNTATQHGFMLAYNQLSSNSTLRTQSAGGLGRKGAQRLVILETDGMANVNTNPTRPFVNNGAGRSYYQVRPGDPIRAASYSESGLLDVARKIAASETDASAGPGYSTARRPLQIHTIAFGAIFEPTASGTDRTNAVDLLQKISTAGRTTFPSSATDANNGYKWCIGTLDERKTKLRQAFSKIMDDGISVSLIE